MFALLNLLACAGLSAAWLLPQLPMRTVEAPLPLIIWHGLGDNIENEGLLSVGDLAQEVNPGTYVYFVSMGDTGSDDRSATFFGNVSAQLEEVCAQIAANENLTSAPAVNALGFSQGGQFLRGYVERCNSPPVANLVTMGSQHNGISQYQECGAGDWLCRAAQALFVGNTWTDYVQSHVVPPQYYRDPEDLDAYLEHSAFLADINNERELKNVAYAENMKKLHNFVMYVFEDDTTVIPKQSGWFSEYNATSEEETKLRDRLLYKEDWLGLKWLDDRGRLAFRETPGRHMNITDELLRSLFGELFTPKYKDARVWRAWL